MSNCWKCGKDLAEGQVECIGACNGEKANGGGDIKFREVKGPKEMVDVINEVGTPQMFSFVMNLRTKPEKLETEAQRKLLAARISIFCEAVRACAITSGVTEFCDLEK